MSYSKTEEKIGDVFFSSNANDFNYDEVCDVRSKEKLKKSVRIWLYFVIC